MGVDCRISLPGAVRVKDVATFIGISAGLPVTAIILPGGGTYAKVKGIEVLPCGQSLPECCYIEWTDLCGEGRQIMYHFEGDDGAERIILGRSTPFWIAMGRRLVKFFGGGVDYNDCDSEDCDYHQVPANDLTRRNDDTVWQAFQNRLLKVKPLSPAEIEWATGRAAYKHPWRLPDWPEEDKAEDAAFDAAAVAQRIQAELHGLESWQRAEVDRLLDAKF